MQEETAEIEQTAQVQPLTPKPSNAKFIIPIIILGVLALGLGGWLAYDKINVPKQNCTVSTGEDNDSDDNCNDDNTEERAIKPTTPETIFAAYCKTINCLEDDGLFIEETVDFGEYSNTSGNLGENSGSTEETGRILKLGFEDWETINASVSDGMFGAYFTFFRVSPYDDWNVFYGGQGAISCDVYTPGVLRHAFRNEACWDYIYDEGSTVGEYF